MKKLMGWLLLLSFSTQTTQYFNRHWARYSGDPLEILLQSALDFAYNKMSSWTAVQFNKAIAKFTTVKEVTETRKAIEQSEKLNFTEKELLLAELEAKQKELYSKSLEISSLHDQLRDASRSSSVIVGPNSPVHMPEQDFTTISFGSEEASADIIRRLSAELEQADSVTQRELHNLSEQKQATIDKLEEENRRLKSTLIAQQLDVTPTQERRVVFEREQSALIEQLQATIVRLDRENEVLRSKILKLEEVRRTEEEFLQEDVERALHSPITEEMQQLAQENAKYKEVFQLIAPALSKVELPSDTKRQLARLFDIDSENSTGEEVYEIE